MTIGKKIKELREELGLNQRELGERVELKAASISAFENGTANPSAATLKKMSELFGKPVKYFTTNEPVERILNEKIAPSNGTPYLEYVAFLQHQLEEKDRQLNDTRAQLSAALELVGKH